MYQELLCTYFGSPPLSPCPRPGLVPLSWVTQVIVPHVKQRMAVKKKPIDEADEKVRLKRILETVGVREVIREELSTALLLWKHDEDLINPSK